MQARLEDQHAACVDRVSQPHREASATQEARLAPPSQRLQGVAFA
jgi:hypothetical protein